MSNSIYSKSKCTRIYFFLVSFFLITCCALSTFCPAEPTSPNSPPTTLNLSGTGSPESGDNEPDGTANVIQDYLPLFRVYDDGRVVRSLGTETVPAGSDSRTGVESKDVNISDQVSARLYLPSLNNRQKLPLVVYYHGGGFCIESAFSPTYHNHLNQLSSEAGVVVVSVEYRKAPDSPLPIAFEDSWAAFRWVQSHAHDHDSPAGSGNLDPWLTSYADFSRVFIAGDSAGANIAHHMGIRAGVEGLTGKIRIEGMILVHPYFSGRQPIGDENPEAAEGKWGEAFWKVLCPDTAEGLDDPWLNPAKDPNLKMMVSDRVLIFVAGKDVLRDRGVWYKELLEKSGWKGEAELVETTGEGHVFHLMNPCSEHAVALVNKIVVFINKA